MVLISAFILGAFVVTITYEFLENRYTNTAYYAKSDNIDGLIEEIRVDDYINIKLSGNIKKYCIKTTRTIPNKNSLCWNDIESNDLKLNYIKGKVYYFWIMDYDGNINDSYRKIISN